MRLFLLVIWLIGTASPARAQYYYFEEPDEVAVGLDFGGLIDPVMPTFNLTASAYTNTRFSANVTIGLPGPQLYNIDNSRRRGTFHRKLMLAVGYRVPDISFLWYNIFNTTFLVEVADMRQRYRVSNGSFLARSGTRRISYASARIGRSIQALRVGSGRRFEFGSSPWSLDVQTLVGVRRRTISYSELQNTTIETGTGIFGGFRSGVLFGDDSQEGSEVLPDFAFRLRLLYRL